MVASPERERVLRQIAAISKDIKAMKKKLKRQEQEGASLKTQALRDAYTSGTRASISYSEGLLKHLERRFAQEGVHPVVSKEVFLEYVAVQEKGDINPLMLGIIRKERFTREIILCIMKDYNELKQMYC